MPCESPSCAFSSLVVLPPPQRRMNVLLLTFFRSATNENYHSIAVFAEVNPVARTKINAAFINSGSHALDAGHIALLHARQSSRHFHRRFSVQPLEPSGVRAAPARVQVLAHFDHA